MAKCLYIRADASSIAKRSNVALACNCCRFSAEVNSMEINLMVAHFLELCSILKQQHHLVATTTKNH